MSNHQDGQAQQWDTIRNSFDDNDEGLRTPLMKALIAKISDTDWDKED